MNRIGCVLAVTIALAAIPALAAKDGGQTSVRLLSADGSSIPAAIVLEKGKTVKLMAAANTDGAPVPVMWSSSQDATVSVTQDAPGRATLTALRDWFDEQPGREPTAIISACAESTCAQIAVTCVVSLSGTWDAVLDGMWRGVLPHSEDRVLVFVQRGREITFDAEPGKTATLRLDGNTIAVSKKGSILTVFSGIIWSRTASEGQFASVYGFTGKWTGKRRP